MGDLGVIDLKIDIHKDTLWMGRNQRIERLKTRSIQNYEPAADVINLSSDNNNPSTSNMTESTQPNLIVEEQGTDKFMDLELYWAAAKKDADGFIDVLERVLTEREISLPAILDSVSSFGLGNTLLHVAASYGHENTMMLIAYHFPSLVTKQNSKGDTPLHIAAKAGKRQVVENLVLLRSKFAGNPSSFLYGVIVREFELSLRVKNGKGNTLLHEALINNQTGIALDLINVDPEVIYCLNNEDKSAVYLAAEAGHKLCLRYMLVDAAENGNLHERLEGKSPVHAAVMGRNQEVLAVILNKEPRLIHLRDEEGRTLLHCAASIGYIEGVRYLLGKYAGGSVERDKKGLFPIHMAAIKGHVDVIQELLPYCPDPRELLDCNDHNILHVAAKSGEHDVISYILKTPDLGMLINEKDKDGNTPLHLATIHWHPKMVSALTWDERVDLKLFNNEGFTALDSAEYHMERMASFRKRLTWTALNAARAPRAPSGKILNANRQTHAMRMEPPNVDNYKAIVNTLLLVSTLVATVTFAAGFTMPGGYNNSEEDQGMATMLRHKMFFIFVFCDMIAMYSSTIVAVTLIWAQIGDRKLVLTALTLALPLLGISLTMMSLAFMAGVYLVVSKISWLANAILVMSSVSLVALSVLFLPLYFPVSSSYRFFRYISYYPFCLLILVTGNYSTGGNSEGNCEVSMT